MAPRNSALTPTAAAKLLEEIFIGLKKSQTHIAEETGIARVTLNRFLRGQSELRLSDFLLVLHYVGIDLEAILRERTEAVQGIVDAKKRCLGQDLESVLGAMPYAGRKSYLGHLVAYAELLRPKLAQACQRRLRAEYDQTGS